MNAPAYLKHLPETAFSPSALIARILTAALAAILATAFFAGCPGNGRETARAQARGLSKPAEVEKAAAIQASAPPQEPPAQERPFLPAISGVQPDTVEIGGWLTITGAGFGADGGGAVLFSRKADSRADAAPPVAAYGEASWRDGLIRIRVPDGAVSGPIRVKTKRGESGGFPINIAAPPVPLELKQKKTYSISYSVSIKVAEAADPNVLYIHIPVPAGCASQINRGALESEPEAFDENRGGAAVYKFSGIKAGFSHKVEISYIVDVYGIESADAETSSPAHYANARLVYESILENSSAGIMEDALLFRDLCGEIGIKAVTVTGVLINARREALPHTWNAFWIDGAGWIPVDIALGRGSAPANFNLAEDFSAYYFGCMDNSRIIFSFGRTELSKISAEDITISRGGGYSLQNIWEEFLNISAHSSYWSDISITGIY